MDRTLWEHEEQHVLSIYPDARWRQITLRQGSIRAWCLGIEPIPDEVELYQVLADLDTGTGVTIGQKGKIGHSFSQCEYPLDNHPLLLEGLSLPLRRFVVEFTYPVRRYGMAGPVQPRVRVIMPEISKTTYPYHPHMFVDTTGRDSSACPLAPHESQWDWSEGATISYLDQVAIWLLKTVVWITTGAGVAGFGKWIGPDASHDPEHLLLTVKPQAPCHCGSGAAYSECHMRRHVVEAVARRVQYH